MRDTGGDPACWANLVCQNCGRIPDEPMSTCQHCGEPMAEVSPDEAAPAATTPAPRTRDRDDEGRARNARPRDGLGRPLPYDAIGVQRQPEGVVRGPRETVTEAQRLLDEGKPFHAHEVFEDAWKSGPAEEEKLWRGLAQLAVGVTHAARGNATGAHNLLERGAGNLAGYESATPHDIDIAGLLRWAARLRERLDEPGAPPDPAEIAPRVR